MYLRTLAQHWCEHWQGVAKNNNILREHRANTIATDSLDPCVTKSSIPIVLIMPHKRAPVVHKGGFHYLFDLGPLFTKRSDVLPKISWSLEVAKFGLNISNRSKILQARDFTRFSGKTSYRLVNRGPDVHVQWHNITLAIMFRRRCHRSCIMEIPSCHVCNYFDWLW